MHRIVVMVLFSVLLGSAWLAPAWGVSYTFTTIDVPGSISTIASGINNAGQIVGFFFTANRLHGFLLSGSTFTTLAAPVTFALGINDAGHIVGGLDHFDGTEFTQRAFLLSGGHLTPLAPPPRQRPFLCQRHQQRRPNYGPVQ